MTTAPRPGPGSDPTPCPRCSRPCYPNASAARLAIAEARDKPCEPGRRPPARIYRCEDLPRGPWHTTSAPLRPMILPDPTERPDLDLIDALVCAIRSQPGRAFPNRPEFAARMDIDPGYAGQVRKVLKQVGLLVPDDCTATLRTPISRRAVTVDQVRDQLRLLMFGQPLPPLLPLPDPPADPARVPEALLEALLANPPGARLPNLRVLSEHFGLSTERLRAVRAALLDLGWLRRDGDHHLTARADAGAGITC